MSQEAGMFSVRRPRETLGSISHNASAIPMPASAMKRSSSQANFHQQPPNTAQHVRTTSASRMSLAPGRPSQPMFSRSSSGGNMADMGFSTVQRPSTANFLGSTSGRKSYAPVTSTPANPMQQLQDSTQRRSSVYSARPSAGFGPVGHQSFFATAPPQNGIPTDPRRLRNLATRTQMAQEIGEFVSQRNFELETKHTLSPQWTNSPTQKDFEMLFRFMYHCIDPAYRFQKAIDVEAPPLLKQLRYPFEKNISKSGLAAAASGNNWPNFIGLLHWMMNLALSMEQYAQGAFDDACAEAGYDVSGDRITFQFLSDAYKEWLSIEDDDDDEEEAKQRIQPHVDAMAAKFEQANVANVEQVKQLEAESKALQEQIDELAKSAPRLAKLDEQMKILEEDRVKFENYNASMEGKVEKYQNRAQLLLQEIEKSELELQEAEADRDDLQRRVDEQGLSVQDIDRMTSERERLHKSAEATSLRLEETKDRTSKKQAETSSKLDDLQAAVHTYNTLGYELSLIPSTAVNANGHDHELTLNINAGPDFSASQFGTSSTALQDSDRLLASSESGYLPQHLLRSDLKASKRALQTLRKLVSERRTAAMQEDMEKMDMLDKSREALEDKYAEMETLNHRLRAAKEEADTLRDLGKQQQDHSDAQIERLEKELGRMRAGVSESVQLMEQREMGVGLEYEQLTHASAALREELHTELERMLNDIIKFKIHVQGSLEAYEEFVASEVDREMAEQEGVEDQEDVAMEIEEDAA
nr:hypothetical protein B0A51_10334 [Rachicladosporium sp. CCFEE 5018]